MIFKIIIDRQRLRDKCAALGSHLEPDELQTLMEDATSVASEAIQSGVIEPFLEQKKNEGSESHAGARGV